MSQILPAFIGLSLFVGLMGGGQAVVRRYADGRWSTVRKPTTFQYGLQMRDLAISDVLLDNWTEALSTKEGSISETQVKLEKELERELDNLLLEVYAQTSKATTSSSSQKSA